MAGHLWLLMTPVDLGNFDIDFMMIDISNYDGNIRIVSACLLPRALRRLAAFSSMREPTTTLEKTGSTWGTRGERGVWRTRISFLRGAYVPSTRSEERRGRRKQRIFSHFYSTRLFYVFLSDG